MELHFLFLFNHQKQRFLSNNWEKADALDMMNVYNGLPFEDRTRFCVLCSLIKVNNDGLEIKLSKGGGLMKWRSEPLTPASGNQVQFPDLASHVC